MGKTFSSEGTHETDTSGAQTKKLSQNDLVIPKILNSHPRALKDSSHYLLNEKVSCNNLLWGNQPKKKKGIVHRWKKELL